MPGFLRQSTASQSRSIGPFVDDTDFKTTKTGLTINNTDIKLMANGGVAASKNSGGGTHRINGDYLVTFDATDTATVGQLKVSVVVASALPVFDCFTVLTATVYDALFGSSAAGFGTAQTGDNYARLGAPAGASISADVAAAKVDTAAIKVQTDKFVFTVANQVDSNVLDWKSATAPAMTGDAYARIGAAGAGLTAVAIGTGGISTLSFTAGAIDAAAIATDAIGSAEMSAAAANKIADALLDRTDGIETSLTFRQAMRLGMAALFGKLSGAGTTTVVFRNYGDSKDRITATVDASGNRSAVTTDAT